MEPAPGGEPAVEARAYDIAYGPNPGGRPEEGRRKPSRRRRTPAEDRNGTALDPPSGVDGPPEDPAPDLSVELHAEAYLVAAAFHSPRPTLARSP
jgi:hypothetical protein